MPKRKRNFTDGSYVGSESEKPLKRAKSGLVKPQAHPSSCSGKHNESSCPLWCLPGNVRDLIYSYVVVPRYARIHYKPHEHRRRQNDKVKFVEHIVGGWRVTWCSEQAFLANGRLTPHCWRPAPISRVCRRLNAETSMFLYSSNIFTWANEWEMRKWLKERLPVQKRAMERIHLEWTITETQRKEMSGLKTLYYSTKGTVCSNPCDSQLRKISERGKDWWKERDVGLVAVEAAKPVEMDRQRSYETAGHGKQIASTLSFASRKYESKEKEQFVIV